jgi:hypothetical protein
MGVVYAAPLILEWIRVNIGRDDETDGPDEDPASGHDETAGNDAARGAKVNSYV